MHIASGFCAVVADQPEYLTRAKQLAQRLGLPHSSTGSGFSWLLRVTARRLELCQGQRGGFAPIYVDFSSGRYRYRSRHGGGTRQLIARAAGLKHGQPTVLDLTAGFGQDAFVLADLGCSVRMLERNPIVAALLQDGLDRAAQDPELSHWLADRLRLRCGDGRRWNEYWADGAEVVYLDPMYPHRPGAALAGKTAQVLRQLAGPDDLHDAAELLPAALAAAARRVVVKRPKSAPWLADHKPSLQLSAGATRYDVYLQPYRRPS